MRDHLHRLPQVFTGAFLLDDTLINLPGRERVESGEFAARESLVVAQIEIGLGPVFQHVNLTVLHGAHRARIDIEIRIKFLNADDEPANLQQRAQGRCRKTLAQ